MSNLSPPPYRDKDITSFAWQKWFASLQALLAPVASGGLFSWTSIDKTGSNLKDLTYRNHSDLQNINTPDTFHFTQTNHDLLVSGNNTTLHYHGDDRNLTNATGVVLDANLANVNSNIGSFGDASHTLTVVADAKGRITAISQQAITLPSTVTAVTGTLPISSSGGTTPNISISQATTSTNGYLSSTDWNTFNSKGSGTVTSVTGTAPVVSSGGATPAISMAAATTSVNGYLTSTDWNTFNNKATRGTSSITFGATPTDYATATITSTLITAASDIEVVFSGADSTVDNPAWSHKMMQNFANAVVTPAAGSATVEIELFGVKAQGSFNMRYVIN